MLTDAGGFRFEPEGIALAPCGEAGYWIATDQDEAANVFHLFDRATRRPPAPSPAAPPPTPTAWP